MSIIDNTIIETTIEPDSISIYCTLQDLQYIASTAKIDIFIPTLKGDKCQI